MKECQENRSSAVRVANYKSGGKEKYLYKYYYWDELKADGLDRYQVDGRLILRSDGRGTFDAVVWTGHIHSGDTWHASFYAHDDNNDFLCTIKPRIDSRKTYGEHVSMHGEVFFPAEKFNQLPNENPRQMYQVWSLNKNEN